MKVLGKILAIPFVFVFGLLCGLVIMLITPFEYIEDFWRGEL